MVGNQKGVTLASDAVKEQKGSYFSNAKSFISGIGSGRLLNAIHFSKVMTVCFVHHSDIWNLLYVEQREGEPGRRPHWAEAFKPHTFSPAFLPTYYNAIF